MARVAEIALIIDGAGDLAEAIQRLTEAGIGVVDSGNHVLVSGNIAVVYVGGNAATANGYWLVYDVHNPSKSKVRVPGRKPDETPTDQPAAH